VLLSPLYGIVRFNLSAFLTFFSSSSIAVTGSCPALMTLNLFKKKYGFTIGLFRRSGDTTFFGSTVDLLQQVTAYNTENEGKSRIVIHSMYEPNVGKTNVNIGVYGNDIEECKEVLNYFAKSAKAVPEKKD
jgi:hypothetical protein